MSNLVPLARTDIHWSSVVSPNMSDEIKLTIRTEANDVEWDLFEKGIGDQLAVGESIEIDDGIKVSYEGKPIAKSIGEIEFIEVGIYFASGVATHVVASWLYDKLNDKEGTSVVINHNINVEVDQASLKDALDDELEE